MIIKGLAKLTLLDYPGKVACTVFTGGCNFRCPFCHNASLVIRPGDVDAIDEEDFFSFLQKRHGVLEGVCVTGGEPTLMPDLEAFLERIKLYGYSVKLDTNGSFPEKLAALVEARLVDRVAVDIKNSPESYGKTVGIENFDLSPIRQTVEYLKSGAVDYEFRTTVVNELHSEADMESIGRWIEGANAYYLQQFIDSGDLIGTDLSAPEKTRMESYLAIVKQYVSNSHIRGM